MNDRRGPNRRDYDILVVGGGHNGLTAAAYLARAGRSVLVLERRPVLGGACVTEEVWPGYRVSTAAYLCSLLHPRIIADLELERFGFDVYQRETSGFTPFEDGSYLFLYPDAAKTAEELRRFCPADVEAYFQFEEDVECAADVYEPFLFESQPSLGRIADAFEAAGIGYLFEPLFHGSVRALLESRFTSDRLMAVLATDGLIGACAGISDPGTAYVLLHHCVGRALGTRGLWGYVRGGMGRISEALAASARAHGAEICADSEVGRIVVSGGRAAGVELADGTLIAARRVLSNAHPHITARLAGAPEPLGYRTEGVSCKINLAVTELPDFLAAPGRDTGPQHLGTVHLTPSLEYLEAAWRDAKDGRGSREPMVEVYIQTATDPGLAPPGRHILSCFTQYFPYTLADGIDPAAETERYADRVMEIIARHAPNVPASVEMRQTLGPRELEARFGLTGGHIFHGDITPAQMFRDGAASGRPGPAGPSLGVDGLLLCGSGAFPGGCVSGIPGFNAAMAILQG